MNKYQLTSVSLRRTTSRISPVMSERMEDKIRELTRRVRQLEDALSVLQATVSKEPHPLLSSEHQVQPLQVLETAHETEKIENNLGSLTIQDNREMFFGPTAGDQALFLVRNLILINIIKPSLHYVLVQYESSIPASDVGSPGNSTGEDGSPEQFPPTDGLVLLSEVFPFLPGGKWNHVSSLYAILDFLPDKNRAWSLCETYFHQV
jgi:hypothetical protein